MKSTPGRVGLHAPHVSRALGPTPAKGATKSGVDTPSFHRLKDQSPTERYTSGTNGERSSAVHGP